MRAIRDTQGEHQGSGQAGPRHHELSQLPTGGATIDSSEVSQDNVRAVEGYIVPKEDLLRCELPFLNRLAWDSTDVIDGALRNVHPCARVGVYALRLFGVPRVALCSSILRRRIDCGILRF